MNKNDIKFEEVKKTVKKLKEILKILNFSEQEAEKQLFELSEIINLKIILKLFKGKTLEERDKFNNSEEIKEFIEKNYSPEEIKQVIKKVTKETIQEYFEILFGGMSQQEAEKVSLLLKEFK